jgi:crossover junction endodeoxyribonuclease RuvC
MGLDPGSLHAGYGLIAAQGSRVSLLAQGRVSAPAAWSFAQRLAHIHLGLRAIIHQYKPRALAIEDVFTLKNPRTALRLAQARGVAILAAALENIPIFEYAPNQIKLAVAGHGRAEKSQVAFLVKGILKLDLDLAPDASDALAAAICHANQSPPTTGPDLGLTKKSPKKNRWSGLTPEDLVAMGYKVVEP